MKKSLFLLVICLGCTGCGTLSNLVHEEPPYPYGGVGKDFAIMDDGMCSATESCLSCISPFFGGGGGTPFEGLVLVALGILDLPLSVVGDTVTLPYVLIQE